MPTETEHRQQAESNLRFLDHVDEAHFPDWAVTVRFYSAVHLVNQVLVRNGFSTDNHDDRKRHLQIHFKALWNVYQKLWTLAQRARYLCRPITVSHVTDSATWLERIQGMVDHLLNPPSP